MRILKMPLRAVLSLRDRGLLGSFQRLRNLIWQDQEMYVLVNFLEPPSAPQSDELEVGDIVLRSMTTDDIDAIEAILPRELHPATREERQLQLTERVDQGVIATRNGRPVGAAWHLDDITRKEPWYSTIEPILKKPAFRSAVFFVKPGSDGRGVSWPLGQYARSRTAAKGANSLISTILTSNRASLMLSTLSGAKVVARWETRWRWGRRRDLVTLENKEQA